MFSNILKNISPVVKNILIINILFFIAQNTSFLLAFTGELSLFPFSSESFKPWQLATHFFMHANLSHIFFNMFALVIFGTQLEKIWGPQRFLIYYLSCALGAALLHQIVLQFEISTLIDKVALNDWNIIKDEGHIILNEIISKGRYSNEYGIDLNSDQNLFKLLFINNTPMLGASGAIFGLLAAFGYLFPNTELMLLFPPIPIKAKYFVIGYAVLELYLGVSNNPSDNVAHFAHLGGALIGIIIVLYWGKNRNSFF